MAGGVYDEGEASAAIVFGFGDEEVFGLGICGAAVAADVGIDADHAGGDADAPVAEGGASKPFAAVLGVELLFEFFMGEDGLVGAAADGALGYLLEDLDAVVGVDAGFEV